MTWATNINLPKKFHDFNKKDFIDKKDFMGKRGFDDKKFGQAKCVDVTSNALADCVNRPVNFDAIVTGAVVKVPVVLAELQVQINVDSIISLPEPALEIKDIRKNLKVTQCMLLQDTNMLFIKGFVRKNIDYATRGSCANSTGFCGDIRHCTVDVPFNCSTPVFFNGVNPLEPVFGTASEFQYLRNQDVKGPEFSEKSRLMSGDLSEFNQVSTEFFNELPFCEIIQSRIVEFDEQLNPTPPHCDEFPFEEKEFKRVEEKMVIFLTIKLLQNRQIVVPPLAEAIDCEVK